MDSQLPSSADSIDYEMLFDRRVAQSYYGAEPEPIGRYYDDARGLFVRTTVDGSPYIQDLIQFAPDALAFTSAGAPSPAPRVGHHRQVIGDDDWVHFCLRLGSGGLEDISEYGVVDQPSRVCMITRYPTHTQIERTSRTNDSWRVACLWVKPEALLRLLETSAARVPNGLSWLIEERSDAARHLPIPLSPRMHLAVNDVLSCQFTGGVRRAFVLSKYLELLATIYQAAVRQSEQSQPAVKLSERDTRKIAQIATIVTSRVDEMESLASLARQVGINRTKLVLGFRALYGTSVEAYWRDWRLQMANDLLRNHGLSVNEVAYRIGYSEISSFTRAFTRKFGVVPKSCKPS